MGEDKKRVVSLRALPLSPNRLTGEAIAFKDNLDDLKRRITLGRPSEYCDDEREPYTESELTIVYSVTSSIRISATITMVQVSFADWMYTLRRLFNMCTPAHLPVDADIALRSSNEADSNQDVPLFSDELRFIQEDGDFRASTEAL